MKESIKEFAKKVRNLEIKIRKAVNVQLHGDYHSIFKGSGLEFEDVREYQYGDDVRIIDWNVTAKGHGTFVKTFKEEKEQTVYFLLDISASQEIGKPGNQKIDIAKEICGVLTLAATRQQSQIGFISFTTEKERYLKPGKGLKHAYQLFSFMFNTEPKFKKTNLTSAFAFALNLIKRRSLVIVISDFIDTDYEKNLRSLAKRHDLVLIQISDSREAKFPALGIIPLYEKESGQSKWVNTSSSSFLTKIKSDYENNINALQDLARKYQVNYINIDTNEDFVPQLYKLFKNRNVARKSA